MQNASLSVDHPVVPVPPPVKFAKVAGKKGKKGAQKAKADNDKYKKLARRAAKLLKKSTSKVDVHVSSSSK